MEDDKERLLSNVVSIFKKIAIVLERCLQLPALLSRVTFSMKTQWGLSFSSCCRVTPLDTGCCCTRHLSVPRWVACTTI